MKLKIRVVDIPITSSAAEAEALLNGPCDDGYYPGAIVSLGLPEGVGARAFFKLRVKPEVDR